MEEESRKLHCIVHLNEAGELICFCPYEESLRDRCACQEQYDCPEALMEITILPNSRPSQQDTISSQLGRASKEAGKAVKELRKSVNRDFNSIKQGLSRLEQSLRKAPFK